MKMVFAFMTTLVLSSPLFAADLHVKIKGLKGTKGQLLISVFDENGYPKTAVNIDGKPAVLIIPAQIDAEVVFELPPGDYSVGVVHDKNKNGKMDRLMGTMWPTDGGTFSRGIGYTGPNKWQDSKITLPPSGTTDEVTMRYWP